MRKPDILLLEVLQDAFDMKAFDGMLTGIGQQKLHVALVILEEIFRQDCGTVGVSKHVEVGFVVAIAIALIHTNRSLVLSVLATQFTIADNLHVLAKVGDGSIIETFSEVVGLRLTRRRIGSPATGTMPLAISTSGIEVDAHIDAIILLTKVVDQTAAHGELTRLFEFDILRLKVLRQVAVLVVDGDIVTITA